MKAKAEEKNTLQSTTDFLTDDAYLEEIRNQMIKFATLQLGDSHQAEDAVQEALIGALNYKDSFGGRSALKTWIFAILKNKIADIFRMKSKTVNIGDMSNSNEDDEDFSELFDRKGFWNKDDRPVAWGNPEETVREGHFWRVMEACLEVLPPKQARAFMMREFIELDADEICTEMNLTISNLHVMLHRSRLRLRECIEDNWFIKGEKKC